jgi:hypothetical protein
MIASNISKLGDAGIAEPRIVDDKRNGCAVFHQKKTLILLPVMLIGYFSFKPASVRLQYIGHKNVCLEVSRG